MSASQEQNESGYENQTVILKDHILSILPNNPGILEVNDPFALFGFDDFDLEGLGIQPSLAIATVALGMAKQEYKPE